MPINDETDEPSFETDLFVLTSDVFGLEHDERGNRIIMHTKIISDIFLFMVYLSFKVNNAISKWLIKWLYRSLSGLYNDYVIIERI